MKETEKYQKSVPLFSQDASSDMGQQLMKVALNAQWIPYEQLELL
jgi:hypothetical protein